MKPLRGLQLGSENLSVALLGKNLSRQHGFSRESLELRSLNIQTKGAGHKELTFGSVRGMHFDP